MRHKILMALLELPVVADICLGDVSEFDETFVLDCYKGKKLDTGIGRKPRKHGAKALKRGISSEYLCICTGIQRKGAVSYTHLFIFFILSTGNSASCYNNQALINCSISLSKSSWL